MRATPMSSTMVARGPQAQCRAQLNGSSQPLSKGAVMTLNQRRPARLEIQRGCIWLTIAGDACDYILSAGQHITIVRRGRMVVQAMEDAHFTISEI